MKLTEGARFARWLLLAVLCCIAFGIVVLDAERGNNHFGAVGRAAVLLAESPWTLKEVLSDRSPMQAVGNDTFDGQSGWKVFDASAGGGLDGFLLLSHYDGNKSRHVVELVSLPDLKTVHRWEPDATSLLEGVPQDSKLGEYGLWNTRMYRIIHPYLFDNGDLLIKDHQSVLIRVSPCSEPVWRNADALYHHSTEPDAEGMLWVPSYSEPPAIPGAAPGLYDDTMAQITPDGKVLYRKSLFEAFSENGLFPLMFTSGTYQPDPLHLNDIQPVLSDGPYWKKGDLFLSLRHKSMVLLYRPSTNQIVWSKIGPWMAQHDVDILDDHRIAVFNNNAYDVGRGGYVKDHAQLLIYDFATDTVTSQFDEQMGAEKVVTQSEGLADRTPDGHVIVEQENKGRVLIFGPDGRLFATYVNTSSDGKVFLMGWSRYISRALGDRALSAMAEVQCRA